MPLVGLLNLYVFYGLVKMRDHDMLLAECDKGGGQFFIWTPLLLEQSIMSSAGLVYLCKIYLMRFIHGIIASGNPFLTLVTRKIILKNLTELIKEKMGVKFKMGRK